MGIILGGGISLANSSPVISYCTISGNSIGGGIKCEGACAPLISHCSITGNSAAGTSGGGIAVSSGGDPVISSCTISGNFASNGGGIAFLDGSNGTIADCIVAANISTYQGGGIYISSSGGAFTIDSSTFSNCQSTDGGGGVYIGQAASVSITGSTFDANFGGDGGGGIYSIDCGNLVIDHCDLVNNYSSVGPWMGGVALNGNTDMSLTNCIFRNQLDFDIFFESYSSASVSYSDFYGSGSAPFWGGPPGIGVLTQVNANGDSCDVYSNVYLDPLFVDFNGGDYHLTENSPCIDAGNPASPYDPDGTVTDMGRYYFDQGSTGIPGGYVSGTWTLAGSPYRVTGDITVGSGSTLTIEPGVVVEFLNFSFLLVNGFLEAVGTEADSILFTGEYWMGLDFSDAPDSSHLTYCIVQNVEDFSSPLYGGITCMNCNPVISHCRISNNEGSSELWGAGGIVLYNSNADISWCNISSNTIAYGFTGTGGGIKIRDSHPTITGCNISDNYGDQRGGGIDMIGNSSLIITNCTIKDNVCSTGIGSGGGIASQGSDMTVTECTISHNVGPAGGGGGIWISGGTAVVTSCTIDSNRTTIDFPLTGPGGGIYADCDSLLVDHCTFVDNTVSDISDEIGWAIHTEANTSLILTNSILRGRGAFDRLVALYGASASISYSDFYIYSFAFLGSLPPGLGELTTTNTNGDSCDVYSNIYLDPLFVDYTNADYHLQEDSPCIDAGDPASPLDPDSTITDMGRYFYDQSVTGIEYDSNLPIPDEFCLQSPYPNPFNPVTTFRIELPASSWVTLEIFDVGGRSLSFVVDGWRSAGYHEVTFDGSGWASGVYVYRLEAGDYSATGKMVLMK
jgi:parallel beta-helix repeat protein